MRSCFGKKIIALACLGVYLFTALGAGGGMLWCVSSDGSLVYEPVHSNAQCANAGAGIGLQNRLSASGRPTGQASFTLWAFGLGSSLAIVSSAGTTCVDTPVPAVQWSRVFDSSRPGTQMFKLLPAAFVSALPSAEDIRWICPLGLVESASPAISLDALRSVILLI